MLLLLLIRHQFRRVSDAPHQYMSAYVLYVVCSQDDSYGTELGRIPFNPVIARLPSLLNRVQL